MSDETDRRASAMTDRIRIAKAQLWEEAKGKLRAMIQVEGQCYPHDPAHQHHRERWRSAQGAVEHFIETMEAEGWQE